jgi:hypothetical protein
VSRGAIARSVIGFPHIRAENVTKLSLLDVVIRLNAYVNLVRGTPNVKWISLRDVRWYLNTAITETITYLARNSIGHPKLQSLTFQCTGIPEGRPPAVQPFVEPLAFFHKLVENTSDLCSVTAIRPSRRFQASLWTVISSTNAYAALRPHVSTVTSLDLNILELTNNPGGAAWIESVRGLCPFLELFVNIRELTLRSTIVAKDSRWCRMHKHLREFSHRLFEVLLQSSHLFSISFSHMPLWADNILYLAKTLHNRCFIDEELPHPRITLDTGCFVMESPNFKTLIEQFLNQTVSWDALKAAIDVEDLQSPGPLIASWELANTIQRIAPMVSFSRIKEENK